MAAIYCIATAMAGCASVRALPSDPPPPGTSTFALRLEKKRLGLFSSTQDATVDHIFADPFDESVLLVTSSDPEKGVYGSADGGRSWTFTANDAPVLAVLFDRAHRGRAFASTAAGLVRTDDGGASWQPCEGFGDAHDTIAEAVALDANGTLYAAASGTLHLSEDGCRSFRARRVQVPGAKEDARLLVRSIAPDPHDPRTMWLSVHPAEPAPARLASLLDSTSEAALAAFAVVDAREEKPKSISFGPGLAGALVTHDGGETWRRTGLALDAWLVMANGALHALAADPMLEAAALVRAHPELASALARQLAGVRVDAGEIAPSLAYPGRRALLAGTIASAPLYRSVDGGATWSRVLAPAEPLAAHLRAAIEVQRAAAPARAAAGEARAAESRGGSGPTPGRTRRRGGAGRMQQRPVPQRRGAPSSEAFLAYLDPARLLAHFNAGRPLTAIAGAGSSLLAYVPTEEFWNRLARAAMSSSDAEGEISLGPEAPPREATGPDAFDLLESTDGGATWSGVEARVPDRPARDEPYPEWIAGTPAAAFVALSAPEREGVFRRVLRISP